MELEKVRRAYILRLAAAITFFMVCVGLEIVTGKFILALRVQFHL